MYETIGDRSILLQDRKDYMKLLASVSGALASDPEYRTLLEKALHAQERKAITNETKGHVRVLKTEVKKTAPTKNATKVPEAQKAPIPEAQKTEVQQPKVSPVKRYTLALNGVLDTLTNMQKDRDENTGFVNALMDDVVSLSGGESGKQIYKRAFDSVKKTALDMESSMKKLDVNTLAPQEKTEYTAVLGILEKIRVMELGDVSVLKSSRVSLAAF